MPDSVPPAVAKSFAALIPAVLTLSIFLFVNAGLTGFSMQIFMILFIRLFKRRWLAWEVVSGQL